MKSNQRAAQTEVCSSRPHYLNSMIFFWIFVICLLIWLFTNLVLRSYTNQLAVENQELINQIESRKEEITKLESDITQLQEKNRVLGMLEGQVSDNEGNVYYYDAD